MIARSVSAAVLLAALSADASGQSRAYPPISDYLMDRNAEVALARSAAPDRISTRATVKVLTPSGYVVAEHGDNGFVCIVMRGWGAPTFTPARSRAIVYDVTARAPICFDPVASRTILPLQELRARLGLDGKDPETIARDIATAYASGALPRVESVAFAYMWSANQELGPGVGAFRPHMMVYAPYYDNTMLGGNPIGGGLPFISDDAGTPFAFVVVPVAGNAAVEAKKTGGADVHHGQGGAAVP